MQGISRSNEPRVIPGNVYECILSPDQKGMPDRLFFLCTTIEINKNTGKVSFHGYTNMPNHNYPDHINEFVIPRKLLLSENMVDDDIIIYYSNGLSDDNGYVDTHGWMYVNGANHLEYFDANYTRVVDIIYLGHITLKYLHDWYMVKDACRYWQLHQHKDIPIKIGDVFEYSAEGEDEGYCLIPMRQCPYDLGRMGYFCMKLRPDGITQDYKIPEDDFKQDIADGRTKYIGYIKPILFRSFFDIYQGYGNPYIQNIYGAIDK